MYLKAIYGASVAGLGALSVAYIDGSVTAQEGVTIAIAVVSALGVIWGVPNAGKE